MSDIQVNIARTSNESIVKFTSTSLSINGSYEFNNIDEAKNSPLAQELFYLPFVKKIFITANFIAVAKYDIVEWSDVEEEVRLQIENYLKSEGTVIDTNAQPTKRTAVEVYAESTPNPAVIKFVSNKTITSKTYEFKNIDESKDAPIAIELFKLPFVKEVFISENYISVTKFDIVEWAEVTNEVRSFIREYLADGKTVISENAISKIPEATTINTDDYDETSLQIISILDEYVKPAVASDGGNIQFSSYDATDKTVHVILQGACSGCPSSTMTLKSGIETMLKQMIPNKIESVIAING